MFLGVPDLNNEQISEIRPGDIKVEGGIQIRIKEEECDLDAARECDKNSSSKARSTTQRKQTIPKKVGSKSAQKKKEEAIQLTPDNKQRKWAKTTSQSHSEVASSCKREKPLAAKHRIVTLKSGETKRFSELYSKVPYSENPEFIPVVDDFVSCSICKMELNVSGQKHHVETHHYFTEVWKCLLCGTISKAPNDTFMHPHIRKEHLREDQYFSCDNCPQTFWTQSGYEQHKTKQCSQRKRRSGICSFCGVYHDNLRSHEQYTHGKREYHCRDCPQVFKGKTALRIHVENTHTDPEINQTPCEICGKLFRNKLYMMKHKRGSHTTEEFPCTFEGCSKVFKRAFNLKQHMDIHLDRKPLSCDYCDFACRQRNSMDVHMRTHHPDKYVERPKLKRWAKSS